MGKPRATALWCFRGKTNRPNKHMCHVFIAEGLSAPKRGQDPVRSDSEWRIALRPFRTRAVVQPLCFAKAARPPRSHACDPLVVKYPK